MENQSRYKLNGILALCLFLVPVVGWITGYISEYQYEKQFRDLVINDERIMTAEEFEARGLSYLTFCKSNRSESGANQLCAFADEVEYVKLASNVTAAIGLLLLALIYGGRIVTGTDRKRMCLVFNPLIRLVMIVLAVSVLAQGALFVYSIYTLEAMAIHRVHFVLLAGIGIGAIATFWVLLTSSLAFLKQEPMFIRAVALDNDIHKNFFSFVDAIASKLKAQAPDHIVVGLEPNFFVTAADVRLVGGDLILKGKTLFVSLGLLRVLSEIELAAVIGHELGHFRGEDVAYSMKFAPTNSRLGKALSSLGQTSNGTADLGRLPAQVVLTMCFLEFASAERSVGRNRELLADRAGAEAADNLTLARALVKVSLFSPQWAPLTNAHIDQLSEGRTFTNLSKTYAGLCREATSSLDWTAAREELGQFVQSHPIDTHPPLTSRLQNLGITLSDINFEDLAPPECAAIGLVAEVEQIEESLSALEVQWLVATGAAVIPQPPES